MHHSFRHAQWFSLSKGFQAVALLCLVILSAPQAAAETTVRYFPQGPIYEYRWKLLELALSLTQIPGAPATQLQPAEEQATPNQGVDLLNAGKIDVLSLAPNAFRETRMHPVKLDILRGLLGYRLLLIRAEDQDRIAQMDAAGIRKDLMFGFHSQWADLAILKANGYSVVTSSRYEDLFHMLAASRFDVFPRGLNEAATELEQHQTLVPPLAIEKTKALYYPYPVYFWVSKKNLTLADRIERGLQLALANGSFRKLFEDFHAKEIAQIASQPRQVIQLHNPVLPQGTPAPETGWWLH